MTTAEAAAMLGVTPGRVRQLISSGELPAEKRGRDHWIEPAAVEAVERRPSGWPAGRPRKPPKRKRRKPEK